MSLVTGRQRWTLFTSDMDYMDDLRKAAQIGSLLGMSDLDEHKFSLREEWPSNWAPDSGWLWGVLAVLLLWVQFLALAVVGLREAGITNLWPFPSLYPALPITLGLAVLIGIGLITLPLITRPSGLVGTASRPDQACVRQRLWAMVGVVIGLGGLGGLLIAHALSASERGLLAASAISALLAAAGGATKLVGRRRSLGQEAVALLRRAARPGMDKLQDQELARLEVLLAASWIPGSRTSWMTSTAAKDFIEHLRQDARGEPAFVGCLERTLSWVEDGSGLVGAFHPDVGLPKTISDMLLSYQITQAVRRMFNRR